MGLDRAGLVKQKRTKTRRRAPSENAGVASRPRRPPRYTSPVTPRHLMIHYGLASISYAVLHKGDAGIIFCGLRWSTRCTAVEMHAPGDDRVSLQSFSHRHATRDTRWSNRCLTWPA